MRSASLLALFRAWNEAGLRYLVVGGHAVIAHGHLRTTHDLDVVIDLEGDQPQRLVAVMERLGFTPRAPVPLAAFANAAERRRWVETMDAEVFSLRRDAAGGLPDEVDVFLRPPFPFAAAYAAALRQELPGGVVVPIVDRETLIAMKRRAGRGRDLDDIAALEGGS